MKSQPEHPDANHNLGVIAVTTNKPGVALPLFKIALQKNPNIEQFWLSYIDVCIKLKKFNEALIHMNISRKFSVSEEKLVLLGTTLLDSAEISEISQIEKNAFLKIWKKRNMHRGNLVFTIIPMTPSQDDRVLV